MYAAGPQDLFVSAADGYVMRRQGTTWRTYKTGVVTYLRGIWGSSAADVFAVGGNGTVVHFDGSSWRTMNTGIFSYLDAVHGKAANDVWAIGWDRTVMHYDGTDWSRVTVGIPQPDRTYSDVWCAPTGEVYIASYWYASGYHGAVLVYDGTSSWTEYALNDYRVNRVWGTAANDVWIGNSNGEIHRFNGTVWALEHTITGDIQSIHGTAGNDVWAVSSSYGPFVPTGEITHYNGTTWSSPAPAVNPPPWQSVAAVSANEVYFRGYESMFAQWNGSDWSLASDKWVTHQYFQTIWGTSTSNIWLLDSGDSAFNTDGTNWTDMYAGTDNFMRAMWGASQDNIYGVGDGGMIVHYDGTSWSEVAHGLGTATLYDIWGTAANDIWVGCRTDGQMWHFNGSAWSSESVWSPEFYYASSIWGAASDDYYAVAGSVSGAGVMHYDGTSWEPVSLGGHFVKKVHGVSSSEVYFLSGDFDIFAAESEPEETAARPPTGDSALIRYNPATHSTTAEYLNARMETLWALGHNNVFVAGTRGIQVVAGHYDGSQVTMLDIDAHTWIYDMWGVGSSTVYLCSGPGVLIRVNKN